MMNNELIPTPMMSFGESVKTCFQKYVTFKGRARRSEYWWFWLLNLIVSIVTLVLDYKLDMINIEFGIGALSGLYTLIVFLPSLAVSVRRLHDTGHSGWYYLLTLCWYLLVTVFNKGRKLTMKTRLLVACLCLVGILLLQDTFGIPLGLPERISRIINTIFGNGV